MNPFGASLSETYTIVETCINCTTPANLVATLALTLVGVGLATHFERRKPAFANPNSQTTPANLRYPPCSIMAPTEADR
jgi:hypothetical protein